MSRLSQRTLLLSLLSLTSLASAELNPAEWTFTGPNPAAMAKAVDNDIATAWDSGDPQTPGMSVVIDLGKSVQVCRIYLTAGREVSRFPRSLRAYVGETPASLRQVGGARSLAQDDSVGVGDQRVEVQEYACFRFPPTKGRFVKLEIGANAAGLPWAIAELDIQAATQEVEPAKRVTVIADRGFIRDADGKPASFSPIAVAVEDLQQYLTRILDAPVDVMASDEAVTGRSGQRIRLVTPPPEQIPSPEPDPKHLDDVSVVREGDEIRISGPTQRAVMFSAYEFLHSQGVRWLYPDPHGETVPTRKALDLSVLPITYRPPFSARGYMAPEMTNVRQEEYTAYLMRHRLTMGWNYTACPIGTIPRFNAGFGWAHTLDGIFEGLEKKHPEWWPGPYREGWCKVPCTSKPEVLEVIMQKMEEVVQERIAKKLPPLQGFSVHPNDAPAFCECPECEKRFGKPSKLDQDGAVESCGTWNYSDRHFYLIKTLAERMQKAHPEMFLKTLAYANHERPPTLINRLPQNTLVDICPWWVPLPVDAPQNAYYRDNIAAWKPVCSSLGIWSYVLIYSDTTFGNPPGEKNLVTPNARAMVSQNKFYQDAGVRLVSTQLMGPQQHWPWGLYAFTRTTWRPDEPAEVVLQDFFRGYYGAAWEPMLAWYETLEKRAIELNIDTSSPDPRLIGPDTIVGLRKLLAQAAARAQHWYEKERVERARKDMEWTAVRGQWRTTADRAYPCHKLTAAPVIDGKLDDVVWQEAPELAGFRIVGTRVDDQHPGRFAQNHPTRFRMGWDKDFLYLGVACQDPAIEKIKAADAKDAKFEYRDVVEVFFAPDTSPFYRQTMVSSAGHAFGPLKIRMVNAHEPMSHPDFQSKTAYTAEGWSMEARFPLSMLAASMPTDGTVWPANLIRVAKNGWAIGEQYSSWSDIPRLHFHQQSLGTWSTVRFSESTLSAGEAAAASQALNGVFAQAEAAYGRQRAQVAAFDAQVRGKPDLAAKESGATPVGFATDWASANRQNFEIVWGKEQPTFDAIRITWNDRRMYRRWYSLEYWDGERFRLLEERRDNDAEVSLHEFAPIKTGRLRLTVWGDLEGWNQTGVVKKIEALKK